MKLGSRIFGLAVGLLMTGEANAADDLCFQLNRFVTDQESESTEPAPRHWAEFHWGIDPDPDTIWSWGCRHSNDASSKNLCGYLTDNTSREFRNMLPIRVLKCMGYRFPDQALQGWHVTEGNFRHQRRDGSWLVMEVTAKDLQSGELAVRIFYDSVDRKFDPEELPPVAPWFAVDGKAQ